MEINKWNQNQIGIFKSMREHGTLDTNNCKAVYYAAEYINKFYNLFQEFPSELLIYLYVSGHLHSIKSRANE
jgi:hypothetical protein